MNASTERSSLLCPNCRRLVSRAAAACPHCGLSRPGSPWKNGSIARLFGDGNDIIRLIITCNVVMFVLSIFIDPRFAAYGGSPFHLLSPSNSSLLVLGSTGTIPIFQLHAWWSLVSASYLHGSLLHIVFNMIALYQLGPLLIKEFGSSRMFTIYTLSGIGGFVLSALMGVRFTIGASAAVCGLIGAALYYGKSRGGVYGNAVYSQISGWALSIFVFGFFVPGINNWGHGGGMAAGALVAMLLGYRERKSDRFSHTFMAILCLVATGLVLAWSIFNGTLFFFL
ncbi:rhomboid family intramembrane serine protease [Desulfopila aestuarii]|uniref:Rhomboid protease GluP n=1 Tax=Desulfopila aestuarii DSM 18488 TaxID=1121416 RepID=A0A1M7YBN6_9BACT|nr:rhomboid family intramembrane serine protease [Desulfopila aestuarii]SHO50001.1 rhomboid protease GluP [Desulfopila aestuarii DSM 18488]